jgi:hypothetical protein
MSHNYWAEFKIVDNNMFRFDTRIYLEAIAEVKNGDQCIGGVVGKNPGSAEPKSGIIGNGIQPIDLKRDKLLPTVKNIITKSYDKAHEPWPKRGYIQVLNLFYLCNPNLQEALSELKQNNNAETCATENQTFPWIWYVWGGTHMDLNPYKRRFETLNTTNHFYYDNNLKEIASKPASEMVSARHTQGLRHEYVMQYISDLIMNGRVHK